MLTSKSQYLFVTQNAMKRIAVEGAPYPARGQKLVRLGEDVAYLNEAIRERWQCGGSAERYAAVILRLKEDISAEYRAVRSLVPTWRNESAGRPFADSGWTKAEAIAEWQGPSGKVLLWITDMMEPDGGDAADMEVADCESDVAGYAQTRDDAVEAAEDALEADIEAASAAYVSAKQAAEAAKADADAATATRLEAALKKADDDYETEAQRIAEDEEMGADEKSAALYESKVTREYAKSTAENKAVAERMASDNTMGSAVWTAAQAAETAYKAAWSRYTASVESARTTYATMARTRYNAAAAVIAGIASQGQLRLTNVFTGVNALWGWTAAKWAMEESRTALLPEKCETTEFLRERPMYRTATKPSTGEPYLPCVAVSVASDVQLRDSVRPSSGVVSRLYADLEGLTAKMGAEEPAVYRTAYTYYQQQVYDGHESGGYWQRPEGPADTADSIKFQTRSARWQDYLQRVLVDTLDGWADTYKFFVRHGHRHEIDWIGSVFATVRVRAEEYTYGWALKPDGEGGQTEGDKVAEKVSSSLYMFRVELVNEGVVEAAALAQIDALRDTLNNVTIPGYAADRDAATKALDETREAVFTALERTYDAAVETAKAKMDKAKADAAKAYCEELAPKAADTNVAVADAEDDAGREKALLDFLAAKASALARRKSAEDAAEATYNAEAEAARETMESGKDAYDEQTYTPARETVVATYNTRVDNATTQCEDAVADIKEGHPDVDENNRCKFSFTIDPALIKVDELPDEGASNERAYHIYFDGVQDFDVTYNLPSVIGDPEQE